MSTPLLAPTFAFRFEVPCYPLDNLWTEEDELPPEHRIPTFGDMEGRPSFADFRMGWNKEGLLVTLRVEGKRQMPWCRDSRIEDSDGLILWIDTRNTSDIHRASRFCHQFILMPRGAGDKADQPIGRLMRINRAKEHPKEISASSIRIEGQKRIDGYLLKAAIPSRSITGFDPAEHPRLGFNYAVADRELGWQTLSTGTEFPIDNDPSLWGVLSLV